MRHFLLFVPLIIIIGLFGCSDRSTAPEPDSSAALTPAEMPADVKKMLNDYAFADERGRPDPRVTYLNPIPSELIADCDIYAVTFIWGDIFGPSHSAEPTDWSGRFSLNQDGVVHVRYLIDFEPGQDSILSHDNPAFAAWVSETQFDFDGLSFLVFIKRNTPTAVIPAVTFETPLFKLQLTAHQLCYFAGFYPIDESCAVAVHSRKIWSNSCPGGFIDGTWHLKNSSPHQGHFDGVWLARNGEPVGIMTCEYWMKNDGFGEFHGYLSGYITTQVIAEIKGHWYYDKYSITVASCHNHGIFFGHYKYMDGREGGGHIKGVFGDHTIPHFEAVMEELPLIGIWHDHCIFDNGDFTIRGD
jgi:hypothetical protein